MVTKIFITAILILVSWQTLLNQQLRSNFENLQNTSLRTLASVNGVSDKIQNQSISQSQPVLSKPIINALQNLITTQQKTHDSKNTNRGAVEESVRKRDRQIADLRNLAMLNGALRGVLQAEVYSMYQNSEAAASTLLATKEAIYKASKIYSPHKDSLIQLMGPIDTLAASWKKGEHKKSSISIRQTLEDVLKQISV